MGQFVLELELMQLALKPNRTASRILHGLGFRDSGFGIRRGMTSRT